MSMIVHNNMSAVHTLNILNQNNNALNKSLTMVASGMKINSAQDDASAYAISERMRVRIRSLDQANQNTQNDSALMKTAEGAVQNTVDILKALKEKAIDAANDSNTDEDRAIIQKEVNQFIDQIDDNALVQFNGKYLVDGSKNNAAYATRSVMFNKSLDESTAYANAITSLKNRAGDSLGIQTSDYYHLSWVVNGKTYFTSGNVGTNNLHTLFNPGDNNNGGLTAINSSQYANYKDKFGDQLEVPNDETALVLIAKTTSSANDGTDTQVSGFTISITDAEGNVRKAANAALDQFKLLQRGENRSLDKSLTFHVGSEANVAIKVGLTDMRAHALGLKGSDGSRVSVTTKENANAAINVFDNALTMALDQITTIGAVQARLEYTAANLTTSSENVQASESTIRDADMAKEMTNYTKNNVLLQSAQAMLAQANQNSSAVLGLLQQ